LKIRNTGECESIIKTLPLNVTVTATGAFPSQTDALKIVSANHFFAMPTLNENFGYVFIEALAAGCPLLISDRTVWDDIESHNSGWRIPLEAPENGSNN
jgi:glycosyltransferase involved in cell wall biosynthesis